MFEDLLKPLLTHLSKEIEFIIKNKLLEFITNEYKRNSYTKTILYRSEPKLLSEIYFPIRLKSNATDNNLTTLSVSGLFAECAKDNEEIRRKNRRKKDIIENIEIEVRQISIIGFAGSGKSTLAKYIVVNCIKENFKIPIKIELRHLNNHTVEDKKNSIERFLFEEIFKFFELSDWEDKMTKLFSSGRFLFLFDGFDEISSENKFLVTEHIHKFSSKYYKNYFIITSRPNAGLEQQPSFKNLLVCDLNLDESKIFVLKQLPHSELHLANRIIDVITHPQSQAYRSYLSNPLLLSMFILTFQSYADLPQLKSSYYRQVFETLFTTHDSLTKLGFEREKKSRLRKEEFEEILQLFSFRSFFDDRFSFFVDTIYKAFNEIKKSRSYINFVNEDLLYDLEVAISILTKDGIIYSFPHRSLQEYFAASYVSIMSLENKKSLYSKFLERNKQDTLSQFFADRQNFFSLLVELDTNDITENFTIPLLLHLKHTFLKIFHNGITNIVTSYNYSNIIINIFSVLFIRNQYCLNILNSAFPSKNNWITLVNNKPTGGNLEDFSSELYNFSIKIDDLVKELQDYIEEKIRNDNDFIRYI